MNILSYIFIAWAGLTLGSCGAFLFIIMKQINAKVVRRFWQIIAIGMIFVPSLIYTEHNNVLFWCTAAGMFAGLFCLALVSANSIGYSNNEHEVYTNNVE